MRPFEPPSGGDETVYGRRLAKLKPSTSTKSSRLSSQPSESLLRLPSPAEFSDQQYLVHLGGPLWTSLWTFKLCDPLGLLRTTACLGDLVREVGSQLIFRCCEKNEASVDILNTISVLKVKGSKSNAEGLRLGGFLSLRFFPMSSFFEWRRFRRSSGSR